MLFRSAQIPGPYLIVAPKTAADTVWRREILRWLPSSHRAIILPELRYQREHRIRLTRYDETTWLIVHPEIVLVQSWWECTEMVQKKRKKTREIVEMPCGKKTEEKNRQQRQLDCGHIKTRKTKKIIQPSFLDQKVVLDHRPRDAYGVAFLKGVLPDHGHGHLSVDDD